MKYLLSLTMMICFINQAKANDEDKYQNIFTDICLILNIDTSKIHLQAENNGLADCINKIDGTAIIHFNIEKFSTNPISSFVGAMCHELGHFSHKDFSARNPTIEGKADEFAGYAMRKLGYELINAEVYLKIYPTNDNGYPKIQERTILVEKGWSDLNQKLFTSQSLNQLIPKVTWTILDDSRILLKIGKREVFYPIIKTRNMVLLYDTLTNCTLQLLDFENKMARTGLARVVTSQGFYCYFRFTGRFLGRNYYQIYYKGELKNLDETSKKNKFDGQDLIVSCRDKDLGVKIQLRLIDYQLCPPMYAMSATYN